MTRGGKTYYYQTNYWGDVTALTDSTGEVVATYEYDAFGNLLKETGTVENPYRYAGYRYDEVTGLYYLQNRYYNSNIGRLISPRSRRCDFNIPISYNMYTYSNNNPIMMYDPDGMRGKWRYRKTVKKYKTWHIKQSTIDAAATAVGFVDKGYSWAKKQSAKRIVLSILGRINRYLWIGIGGLWAYTAATGRKGVTIGYVVIRRSWHIKRNKSGVWRKNLEIEYVYPILKAGKRKYRNTSTKKYY